MTDRFRVVVKSTPPFQVATFSDRVTAESYREAAKPVMRNPLVVQERVGELWVDVEEQR
jgi:hypothetical protein